MSSIKLIVIAPGNAQVTRVSDAGVEDVPIRRDRRFDELAEALSIQLGVPAFIDEFALPAPGDGTIVVCRPDLLYRLEERVHSLLVGGGGRP